MGPALSVQVAGIFTFGAPAVGDAAFASLFDGAFFGRAHRFAAAVDIVPRLPLLPDAAAAPPASCYGTQYVHHCGLHELPLPAATTAVATELARRGGKAGGRVPAAIVCQVSPCTD